MSDVAINLSNLPGIGPDASLGEGPTSARAATSAELRGLRRFALVAAGRLLQGFAMIAAGVFLLGEIPATPGLALQMGILGALLVAGGVAFVHAGLSGPRKVPVAGG